MTPDLLDVAPVSQQQKKHPRLCIVGAGALGSALLDRLRECGFSSVLLIDPEEVEQRNLELSPFLRRAVAHSSPGDSRNKADLLASLAHLSNGLPWRSLPCEIADVGWLDFQDIDLFCCCTDSVLSRVEASWIARSLGTPMLDGGVAGQGIAAGRVTYLPPDINAPCSLCGLSEHRRAAVLGYAASTAMGCQLPESVPAMTAAFATLEAVADRMTAQVLALTNLVPTGTARSLRLSQSADGIWREEQVMLTRSASCPWHERASANLTELPWTDPFEQSLRETAWELLLNWPVCREAVCENCGARSEPMQRVARVRRSRCAVCGQARLQPVKAIHRIRNGTLESTFSPRQLGMPDRHLYWVRRTKKPGEEARQV